MDTCSSYRRRPARPCAARLPGSDVGAGGSWAASHLAYASTISLTSRCRTTSALLNRAKCTSSTPSRISWTTRRPLRVPLGRSTWVMSPVTTILAPNPSRVRNIFICSGVVFCASSRMMNASLSVLCVTIRSSGTYSESAAATWMQTDTAQRAHEEHDIVPQARRAGRVLNPAGPVALGNGPTIGVQQPLEHREADGRTVEPVAIRDELRVGPGPREPDLAQRGRDRVGDDHTATTTELVPQDVVDIALPVHLDARKCLCERRCQFRVPGGERRRRRGGQTAVAEQQPEGVRVDRHLLWHEFHRAGQR